MAAASFVGCTVAVTLRSSGEVLHGVFRDVVEGVLYLSDVYFPATHRRFDTFVVEGREIGDVEVLAQPSGPQQPSSQQQQVPQPPAPPPPSKQQFVDPAIVSVGRPPSTTAAGVRAPPPTAVPPPTNAPPRSTAVPPPPSAAMTTTSAALAVHDVAQPTTSNSHASAAAAATGSPHSTKPASGKLRGGGRTFASVLSSRFDGLNINNGESDTFDDSEDIMPTPAPALKGGVGPSHTTLQKVAAVADVKTGAASAAKKGKKAKKKPGEARLLAAESKTEALSSPEVARQPQPPARLNTKVSNKTGKNGWRSTPIIAETSELPPLVDAVPIATDTKRKSRKQREMDKAATRSGWATEDVTDLEQLGEFDFEANLSKFDKRTVFDQIRSEDPTADEDRLVSHNRLPSTRPGTYGGKNLHPTEMVLDQPIRRRHKSSGSGSSPLSFDSDFDAELQFQRTTSRASSRMVTSRQNSAAHEDVASSGHSRPRNPLHRSSSHRKHTASQPGASPHAKHFIGSPPFSPNPSGLQQSTNLRSPSLPHLHKGGYLRSVTTGAECPTLSTHSLEALEHTASTRFLIPESLLAESIARSLTEIILGIVDPSGHRITPSIKQPVNPSPVIVFLVANHRRGARALASARWLREKKARVLVGVCTMSCDSLTRSHDDSSSAAGWDPDFVSQAARFRALGGRLMPWDDLEQRLKRLDAPPELIVDGLGSREKWKPRRESLSHSHSSHTSSSHDTGHDAIALRMMSWANRSRADVVVLELPFGIDPNTGEIPILEGEPVLLRPRTVMACGAPLQGLLAALASGEGSGWRLCVVDIGLDAAWKGVLKGLRRGRPTSLMMTTGIPGTIPSAGAAGIEDDKALLDALVGGGKRVGFGKSWIAELEFVSNASAVAAAA